MSKKRFYQDHPPYNLKMWPIEKPMNSFYRLTTLVLEAQVADIERQIANIPFNMLDQSSGTATPENLSHLSNSLPEICDDEWFDLGFDKYADTGRPPDPPKL